MARRSSSVRPSRFSRRSKRPGPERRAVGLGADVGGGAQAFERTDEHGQLEVRLRDAHGGDRDARAVEDVLPVAELARARLAVPRPALGAIRLELEQVAAERVLEPGESGLRALGGAAERGLAAARASTGRRRRAPTARAAGRTRAPQPRTPRAERSGAARSAPPRRCRRARPPSRPALHSCRSYTSTTTGRIIGRRRVRS